ncbi:MAG TPA: hypothetical protein VNX68_07470 [Nitrosopumilaceae archaeon]|jgi:hypothetical protein|nr:hypothetical protein [Nitrosopumilaceae archaeon]
MQKFIIWLYRLFYRDFTAEAKAEIILEEKSDGNIAAINTWLNSDH